MRSCLVLAVAAVGIGSLSAQKVLPTDRYADMSSMGSLARQTIQAARSGLSAAIVKPLPGTGDCADGNTRCTPIGPVPSGTQSEVSVAVDSTGQNIVIGFNDFRRVCTRSRLTFGFHVLERWRSDVCGWRSSFPPRQHNLRRTAVSIDLRRPGREVSGRLQLHLCFASHPDKHTRRAGSNARNSSLNGLWQVMDGTI